MSFVLTRLGTKPAPQVAIFSSKGPNPISPRVLKPDIIAPGVDVLAAYVPLKHIKVETMIWLQIINSCRAHQWQHHMLLALELY
ncbi:subtilisin-like protease sbt1.5 [Quercus suber]|uniref:Subtilisin-like protease sbt1.5 n=1 Tax=Quercus suber TaxID=58331 RepID=A0AAW0LBQ3_QUESU